MACMDHQCIGDAAFGIKPCGFWTANNARMATCPKCGGWITSIFDEDPEVEDGLEREEALEREEGDED